MPDTVVMKRVEKDAFDTAVHFVGFRDERYWSAVKVWGKPDFIHPLWDRRATHDADEGDVFVFANGNETWPVSEYSWNDSERM